MNEQYFQILKKGREKIYQKSDIYLSINWLQSSFLFSRARPKLCILHHQARDNETDTLSNDCNFFGPLLIMIYIGLINFIMWLFWYTMYMGNIAISIVAQTKSGSFDTVTSYRFLYLSLITVINRWRTTTKELPLNICFYVIFKLIFSYVHINHHFCRILQLIHRWGILNCEMNLILNAMLHHRIIKSKQNN